MMLYLDESEADLRRFDRSVFGSGSHESQPEQAHSSGHPGHTAEEDHEEEEEISDRSAPVSPNSFLLSTHESDEDEESKTEGESGSSGDEDADESQTELESEGDHDDYKMEGGGASEQGDEIKTQKKGESESESGSVFEVKSIKDSVLAADGEAFYLVSWRGVGPDGKAWPDTWEPAANLQNCSRALEKVLSCFVRYPVIILM